MTYTKITPEFGDSYIEWNDNGIIRFIPMDESNSNYQAYLAYVANGSTLVSNSSIPQAGAN